MAIQTLYNTRSEQNRGQTTWINKSDKSTFLRLRGNNGPLQPIEVKAGEKVLIDSGYDAAIPAICSKIDGTGKPCLVRFVEPAPTASTKTESAQPNSGKGNQNNSRNRR